MKQMETMTQTETMKQMVVTGCSTGFGRATALLMARSGWRVWATVRKEADAQGLISEVGGVKNLVPVVCDIVRAEDIARLRSDVAARGGGLDALVNNAGTGYPGPLELIPLDDVRKQLELNTTAQLAVTQALLPMLRAAHGMLINVSSVGGRVTFPMNGAYHMSKWAVEAMSDTLRVELAPFGVRVVIIEPGYSPTAIWDSSLKREVTAGLPARDWGDYTPLAVTVEQAARAGAAGGFPPEDFAKLVHKIVNSRRPRTRYTIGREVPAVLFLRRLGDRVWDWSVRRTLRW